MAFAVKVVLVLLSVFVLEFYFFKKILGAIKTIFPNVSKRKINIFKRSTLTIINIYPLIAIAAWIYVIINKTGYFQPPQNIFFDYLILYPFWVGTIIIIQATLFFLIADLLSLLTIIFYSSRKNNINKIKSAIVIVIFVLSFVYVPFRIVYDYKSVDITYLEYSKTDLPKVLDGFTITFISDIQADRYTDEQRLSNFIRKINAAEPDLVLMAGDMITSTPDYIKTAAKFAGKIKSVYGVYTCVGDHDNWAYRDDYDKSLKEITAALSKVNIPMIDNNNLFLGIDSANIEVTFITNTYVERINENLLDSLTNNNNKADLRIFLTHQPRQFLIDKAAQKKYNLYLCGHTHGGQLTFLFPFYNLSPTMIETPYMRGERKFGNMLMVVTKGLGMSLAPLRYNSTPEVTVITLKKNVD